MHPLSRAHTDIDEANSRTFRDIFNHFIVIFKDLNVIHLFDLYTGQIDPNIEHVKCQKVLNYHFK